MESNQVQMYYVSQGSPVALGSLPKPQVQASRQQHDSRATSTLGEAFVYKPVSQPTSHTDNKNGNNLQRSDSLESLLSLNVLAFQLLNGHEEVQGADNECE
jgi:hypothetical protein